MDFFFGWFGGTWPGKPPNLVPGDSRRRRNQSSQWTQSPNPASAVSPALSCCLGSGSSKQGICLDCGDRPNFSVPTHSHFMWNQLHPGTTLEICWLGICHIHFARYTVLICTNIIYQLLLVFPQKTAIGVKGHCHLEQCMARRRKRWTQPRRSKCKWPNPMRTSGPQCEWCGLRDQVRPTLLICSYPMSIILYIYIIIYLFTDTPQTHRCHLCFTCCKFNRGMWFRKRNAIWRGESLNHIMWFINIIGIKYRDWLTLNHQQPDFM